MARSLIMQPANSAHLLFLDNQGILFHELSQKIYHFNTVATYIWCLLEEEKSQEQMLLALQKTFSIHWELAQSYLNDCEKQWQKLGILQGFEQEESQEVLLECALGQYDDSIFVACNRYCLLDTSILLRFTHKKYQKLIDPALAHLSEQTEQSASVVVDVIECSSGCVDVYLGQRFQYSCPDVNRLAPLVNSVVWQVAIERKDSYMDIHASVVGDGRYCYLFPASPGSGKSTLSVGLAHQGFEFFTDERAMLSKDGFQVSAVPIAINVKDSGVDVLSRYYPQLSQLTRHHRGDGKKVRFLPPLPEAMVCKTLKRPVGAIVFPQYSPENKTQLIALKPVDAFARLLEECLSVSVRLDVEKVSAMIDWIAGVPCYALPNNDLDQAIELIKKLSLKRRRNEC